MIKIIFFDIDGTLIEFGTTKIKDKVAYALHELQKQGIKLFIATGRPKFVVPYFDNVEFDGYLTYNGGYCFQKDRVLYKNPLDKKDLLQIIENAKKMNTPINIAGLDRMGSNFYDETMEEYFRIASQHCFVLDDYDELLKEDIYEAMYALPESMDSELLSATSSIQSTRWWPKAADLIPFNSGKEYGIMHVLEAYGYTKEEAMAFGDGGNDITMLQAVGCGIAMGNATEDVKAIADYITDSVEEDGIYTALVKMGLVNAL